MTANRSYPKWDYQEYPKTLAEDDLWGQVRRTVMGKPVSEEQISLMIHAISEGLDLQSQDTLLDIGCGNGALSSRLFSLLDHFIGVDASPYLIEIGQKYFSSKQHQFICNDALSYLQGVNLPDIDKVLCFAVFSYLSDEQGELLLGTLHEKFPRLNKIFLGNLPDRERAHLFFSNQEVTEEILHTPHSQIGVWRTVEQLKAMAERTGWCARVQYMPPEFYQAHYRFNLILERSHQG